MLIEMVSRQMTASFTSADNAILDKLTPAQIDRTMDLAEKAMDYRHTENTDRLKYRPWMYISVVAGVLVFILAFAWLCLAYQKSDMVLPVVTLVLGFSAGGGVGYSIGHSRKPKTD